MYFLTDQTALVFMFILFGNEVKMPRKVGVKYAVVNRYGKKRKGRKNKPTSQENSVEAAIEPGAEQQPIPSASTASSAMCNPPTLLFPRKRKLEDLIEGHSDAQQAVPEHTLPLASKNDGDQTRLSAWTSAALTSWCLHYNAVRDGV